MKSLSFFTGILFLAFSLSAKSGVLGLESPLLSKVKSELESRQIPLPKEFDIEQEHCVCPHLPIGYLVLKSKEVTVLATMQAEYAAFVPFAEKNQSLYKSWTKQLQGEYSSTCEFVDVQFSSLWDYFPDCRP